MSFLLPTSTQQIESFAIALGNTQLGKTTLAAVNADIYNNLGLTNTLNYYYSALFGATPVATLSASLVANVGIVAGKNGLAAADVAAAFAYVTGTLTAAAPAARGAAVMNILTMFSGLSTGTYAAASSAYNALVQNAVVYGGTVAADSAPGVAAPGTTNTFTLTTGVDSGPAFTGAAGSNIFTAPVTSTGGATFGNLDQITGFGTSNSLNIAGPTTGAYTMPTGFTVSGVQNVNASFTNGGTFSTRAATTGFTGVTALSVSGSGGLTVSADPTTAITVSNVATGNASTVDGGSSVSYTSQNAILADTINVGNLFQPVGPVTIVQNNALAYVSGANAAITVKGGTVDTINNVFGLTPAAAASVLSQAVAANQIQQTGGSINVTGTSATTSVSVTQANPQTAWITTAAATAGHATNQNNQFNGQQAQVDGAVTILDASAGSSTAQGTIASVTLSGYGDTTTVGGTVVASESTALTHNITSNALNTLTLNQGSRKTTLNLNSTMANNPVTTLTINVGLPGTPASVGSLGNIVDTSAHFTTLNLVGNATTASITGFADANLRTLNVSGTGVITVSIPSSSNPNGSGLGAYGSGATGYTIASTSIDTTLTALNVTGKVGLTMDLSAESGLTNIVMGNSGNNTITLNSGQSYTGGTGNDIVLLTSPPLATATIVGGGGKDRLVLNGPGASFLTNATTLSKVTGFTVVGTGTSSSGVFDLANDPPGINEIFVAGAAAGSITFRNVTPGMPISINTAQTSGNSITYQTSDLNGPANSAVVNLAPASGISSGGGGTAGFTVNAGAGALIFNDSISQGVGTLTFNTDASAANGRYIIGTLTDSGLSALNINGTGALQITALGTVNSNSLIITDNDTSINSSSIGTITAPSLSSLTYAGSHSVNGVGFTISNLLGDLAAGLSITNSGTGTFVLSNVASNANLTSVRLNGQIQGSFTSASAANLRVLGSTDNAPVSITHTTATVAGLVAPALGDVIQLGSGGDATTPQVISTGAGSDTITVGSGRNKIVSGTGADTITLGSHSGGNALIVMRSADASAYVAGTNNATDTSGTDVIYGMRTGDIINVIPTAAAGGFFTLPIFGTRMAQIPSTIPTGNIYEITGTYNSATQQFSGSATGNDTYLAFNDGTNSQAVVLPGYVAGSQTANVSGNSVANSTYVDFVAPTLVTVAGVTSGASGVLILS